MARTENESKTENTSEFTEGEHLLDSPKEYNSMNKIEDIPCIVPKKADVLREAGYESIEDLIKSNKRELSNIENIGYGLAARIKTHTNCLTNRFTETSKPDEENSSDNPSNNQNSYKNKDLPDKIKNISGIDELVAEALRETHNDSVEDIIKMSNTELTEIDGVDRARATHIQSDINVKQANKPEPEDHPSNKSKKQSQDRETISATIQPAERSFKEGIARYIGGSQTVARIRFRQARDAFEEADQVISTNDTEIFAQPIGISFEQQATLPSETLEDLTLVEESTIETLATAGIESITDLESDTNKIKPEVVTDLRSREDITAEEADILTILSWWYEGDSREFGNEAELSQ